MEGNICDLNHLEADAHLPPRKRLLAGLKKQNIDGNSHQPSTSNSLSEFETQLNNLLRSHLNNPPNLSLEEIVEASTSEAMAAVKAAKVARAAAEEKAEIAAKAMAAAKSALELVAAISEETASNSHERSSKKSKMKKHTHVQIFYNKQKRVENCRKDEELARNLHRVINSSPRILKCSSTSDSKSHKYKRPKRSSTPERSRVSNGRAVWEENPPSTSNGDGILGEVDSEGDENTSKFNKADRLKMGDREIETSNSKEKTWESLDDTCSVSRKRGRIKQKKLPLSICTFNDRVNPKEERISRSSPLTVEPSANVIMPAETKSMWKCQAFKAPVCAKQKKVVQS